MWVCRYLHLVDPLARVCGVISSLLPGGSSGLEEGDSFAVQVPCQVLSRGCFRRADPGGHPEALLPPGMYLHQTYMYQEPHACDQAIKDTCIYNFVLDVYVCQECQTCSNL